MHRPLLVALLIVTLGPASCVSDASVDLSVRARDGRRLTTVDVVVCSARDRSDVIDSVSLGASSSSTVRVAADGRAVAFAATTPDGLCAASCQLELDEGATIDGVLDLVPCLACARAEPTAANVCRDPLCFVSETDLSACASP